MLRRRGFRVTVFGLAVMLGGCSTLPSGFQTSGLRTLTSGEWHGIAIGMDRDAARQILLRDDRFDAISSTNLPAGKAFCGNGDAVDHYRTTGLLAAGHVEVYSREGRIVCLRRWKRSYEIS